MSLAENVVSVIVTLGPDDNYQHLKRRLKSIMYHEKQVGVPGPCVEAICVHSGHLDDAVIRESIAPVAGILETRVVESKKKRKDVALLRQLGLHEASGKFTAYLEPGYVFLPNHLEAHFRFLQGSLFGFSFSNYVDEVSKLEQGVALTPELAVLPCFMHLTSARDKARWCEKDSPWTFIHRLMGFYAGQHIEKTTIGRYHDQTLLRNVLPQQA